MKTLNKLICMSLILVLTGCSTTPSDNSNTEENKDITELVSVVKANLDIKSDISKINNFGESISYNDPKDIKINKDISEKFKIDEITNLTDIEEAYDIKFSEPDLKYLEENKFLIKNLLETNIRPKDNDDHHNYGREFVGLYGAIYGGSEQDRAPHNTVFWTSDVFMHSYNLLYTELLKEIENKYFYQNMLELSEKFYNDANNKIETETDKEAWIKIRNYFAIPYIILKNVTHRPENIYNYKDPTTGEWLDPFIVEENYKEEDKNTDTKEKIIAFAKTLDIDQESKDKIIKDLEIVYDAEGTDTPTIFEEEYKTLETKYGIKYKIDYSQFTPRSHYTGSSLRRQYFRAMKWYIDTPFFIRSAKLTDYAFKITKLLAENEKQLTDYNQLESTINFLVGTSDDLMPIDYIKSLESTKDSADREKDILKYLTTIKTPKIKSLAAEYNNYSVDPTQLILGTKGMRFFSGKFIIDSYWTDYLTQGDEDIQEGYTQKLPPMASSLEVMTLLGSDYAKTQIKSLDFYKNHNEAIDQAIKELEEETNSIDKKVWQENVYYGWLYTIKGLFTFEKNYKDSLPQFMSSDNWAIKTLMSASGFWTELRHATLLYAKQSFAEMGGGAGDCNEDPLPEPPKGYIEPQLLTYYRLHSLSKKTLEGLKAEGFELKNTEPLEDFIKLMDLVISYTEKELDNTKFNEKTIILEEKDISEPDGICRYHQVEESDWENIRAEILNGLIASKPIYTDGENVSVKDKRVAIISDVHTGGDRNNPRKILYEGIGVPKVIFVAVKDINGPRLTVGFTYSHYEFTKEYGGKRLTDEEWQENFYNNEDPYFPYIFKELKSWPKHSFWYNPILR